jgi:hypothetical protein
MTDIPVEFLLEGIPAEIRVTLSHPLMDHAASFLKTIYSEINIMRVLITIFDLEGCRSELHIDVGVVDVVV